VKSQPSSPTTINFGEHVYAPLDAIAGHSDALFSRLRLGNDEQFRAHDITFKIAALPLSHHGEVQFGARFSLVSSEFWVSTLIILPVSIIGSLAAPPVQRWITHRGETSHAKKRAKIQREYEQVIFYALRPEILVGRLAVAGIVLISMTFFMTIGGMLAPPIGMLLNVIFQAKHLQVAYPALAAGLAVSLPALSVAMATVLVINTFLYALRYIKLFHNVSFFESYADSVPIEFRDFDAEKLIRNAAFDRAFPGFEFAKQTLIEHFRTKSEGGDGKVSP
jgi:hypothetical protein